MYRSYLTSLIIIITIFSSCQTTIEEDGSIINTSVTNDKDHLLDELGEIEREIVQKPKSPNVYMKRALYYQKKRQFPEAVEDINRAISLAPDASIIQYHKAAILYEFAIFSQDVTMLDESKIYLDNCILSDDEIINPRLLRAKIYLFEKKTDNAIRLVNDVLKIDQRVAEAYFIKGMVYEFLENAKLAASSYQTAIEMDPNFFDAYIHMGMLYERLKDDRAINYYNSAISIEPNSLEAHRNKGLHLHFNGKYIDARKSFRKVLSISPQFEEAFFNIGNTFLGQYALQGNLKSDLDSAFHYYFKAINMNPKYVQACHNLGVCYEEIGDDTNAKSFYKKAIDLDNDYQPALDAINAMDLN